MIRLRPDLGRAHRCLAEAPLELLQTLLLVLGGGLCHAGFDGVPEEAIAGIEIW